MKLEVFGEARGSRALAGVGIVVRDESGRERSRRSVFLGVATRAQAEYRAIVEGLRSCSDSPVPSIVTTSHEAAIRQILGKSSAHVPETAELLVEARDLLASGAVTLELVPERDVLTAEKLAAMAIDSRGRRTAKD